MKLGEQISTRRKMLGLLQEDLAARVGITPSHVSLIESDKRDPSLRVLAKIALALKTRVTVALVITP